MIYLLFFFFSPWTDGMDGPKKNTVLFDDFFSLFLYYYNMHLSFLLPFSVAIFFLFFFVSHTCPPPFFFSFSNLDDEDDDDYNAVMPFFKKVFSYTS